MPAKVDVAGAGRRKKRGRRTRPPQGEGGAPNGQEGAEEAAAGSDAAAAPEGEDARGRKRTREPRGQQGNSRGTSKGGKGGKGSKGPKGQGKKGKTKGKGKGKGKSQSQVVQELERSLWYHDSAAHVMVRHNTTLCKEWEDLPKDTKEQREALKRAMADALVREVESTIQHLEGAPKVIELLQYHLAPSQLVGVFQHSEGVLRYTFMRGRDACARVGALVERAVGPVLHTCGAGWAMHLQGSPMPSAPAGALSEDQQSALLVAITEGGRDRIEAALEAERLLRLPNVADRVVPVETPREDIQEEAPPPELPEPVREAEAVEQGANGAAAPA